MRTVSLIGLRTVLVLAGTFTAFTGINIAFGGIPTLGWQGQTPFFAVTDPHMFLVQDSHIRFLGGVWIGVGALMLLAATNLKRYQAALNFVFAVIFLGGLVRFAQMHLEITLGREIVGSLIAEIVGMPLLYFWVSRTVAHVSARAA